MTLLQISVEAKIPLYIILGYVGATIWFFIREYFKRVDLSRTQVQMEAKLKKNEEEQIKIKEAFTLEQSKIKETFTKELESLKKEFHDELKSIQNRVTELNNSIIKLTTVVEMKLLEMRSGSQSAKHTASD